MRWQPHLNKHAYPIQKPGTLNHNHRKNRFALLLLLFGYTMQSYLFVYIKFKNTRKAKNEYKDTIHNRQPTTIATTMATMATATRPNFSFNGIVTEIHKNRKTMSTLSYDGISDRTKWREWVKERVYVGKRVSQRANERKLLRL